MLSDTSTMTSNISNKNIIVLSLEEVPEDEHKNIISLEEVLEDERKFEIKKKSCDEEDLRLKKAHEEEELKLKKARNEEDLKIFLSRFKKDQHGNATQIKHVVLPSKPLETLKVNTNISPPRDFIG